MVLATWFFSFMMIFLISEAQLLCDIHFGGQISTERFGSLTLGFTLSLFFFLESDLFDLLLLLRVRVLLEEEHITSQFFFGFFTSFFLTLGFSFLFVFFSLHLQSFFLEESRPLRGFRVIDRSRWFKRLIG